MNRKFASWQEGLRKGSAGFDRALVRVGQYVDSCRILTSLTAQEAFAGKPVAVIHTHQQHERAAAGCQIARRNAPLWPRFGRILIEARRIPCRRAHSVPADNHNIFQLGWGSRDRRCREQSRDYRCL